jgi:UDP-N-acetylmuramate dehydrogenase
MNQLLTTLSQAFPKVSFKSNHALAPLTYFKIGGPAEMYAEINDLESAVDLITFCRQQDIRYTILGGGSNVLISDKGIRGLVLRLTADKITDTNRELSDDKRLITAEVGVKTSTLVAKTIALGYSGLEYFMGVPGTLGGAIYNNAHYLSDLIGEHVHRVEVLTTQNSRQWLSQSECQFGYDSSRFHSSDELILQVEFALSPGNPSISQEKVAKATRYRADTQPLGPPSSGCIFQNTPNNQALINLFPQFADRSHVPTGFLIDQAGLKGLRVGDIEVSQKHAAWLINLGQGTAADVKEIVSQIKNRVKEKFAVEIKEEIFYLE